LLEVASVIWALACVIHLLWNGTTEAVSFVSNFVLTPLLSGDSRRFIQIKYVISSLLCCKWNILANIKDSLAVILANT